MSDNCYFFGIDGGGTHSRIAITDKDGNVIAGSKAGSTNIFSVSKEEIFKNLSLLLDSSLDAASLKKQDLKGGCIGSAGLSREKEQKLFREFFNELLGARFPVKLCGDGEILLCGGLDSFEGYCLIAGTGSIALGRTADGVLVRAGGYGYLLGDEGSAAWIGKTAIVRALRSLEKRDIPTGMLSVLLEAAGLTRHVDFVQYVHHDADKAKIAALAPLVTAAARSEDALALDILRVGADELTQLVKSVVEQSPQIQNRKLVLAGGVMEHDEIVTGRLKENLARDFSALTVASPKRTALEGACSLAINLFYN